MCFLQKVGRFGAISIFHCYALWGSFTQYTMYEARTKLFCKNFSTSYHDADCILPIMGIPNARHLSSMKFFHPVISFLHVFFWIPCPFARVIYSCSPPTRTLYLCAMPSTGNGSTPTSSAASLVDLPVSSGFIIGNVKTSLIE